MLAHRLATSRIALRYTAKWKYHRTEKSCEKIQLLNICNLECASRALRPATKVERYFWGQCLGWWKGNSSGLSRAELITLPWLPEPQATNGLPWHWKTTQEKAVFLLLLRTQLIKCELSGDSMPFSSPQIPSVSRELSIVTWWEQCWDLLLQQQLLQNCPKVLNPHVYFLVSVVKVILLLSGHQTWVSNEESQLWPSSHQLEKWDLKGPLEIGKNVGSSGKAGREEKIYINNRYHHLTGPITWQDTHQALQSLLLSSCFLCLSPSRSWKLRQRPTRPDRFLKKPEVLHPALGTR